MRYFDTSVIGAYYCPEGLSEQAQRLLSETHEPCISALVEVEMASAVSRKIREKTMNPVDARKVLARLKLHISSGLYRMVAIEARHFSLAAEWIAEFTTSLRTLDALHLAAAFECSTGIVTADVQQAKAAEAFGIEVLLLK